MHGARVHGSLVMAGLLGAGLPALAGPSSDPLIASPSSPWSTDNAAHLLRRAGFGGSPESVLFLTRLGRDKAVDYLVDFELIKQTCPAYPSDQLISEPPRGQFAGLDEEQRKRLFNVVRRLGAGNMASMQDWWLQRMVDTPRPLEEKMTLFWHGHFTSGFKEVKRPEWLHRQNEFLRQHALSDFRTLLMGISRDPAMLAYLDNGKNVKEHPNENYARELMELFTLGEGNYTEQDVKEAARAFTGWSADREGRFVVRVREHDNGPKTFLGKTGNFDGDDIINIILEQPAAGRFLARKLCRFFVSPEPDPVLVDALAEELRSTDYDMRETLRTLLRSDAFYHAKYRFGLIKSPAELMASTARALDIPIEDLRAANQAMNQMGQELFQPPNVKGWDGGRNWITTSTLFIRYNAMKALLEGTAARGRNERPLLAALLQKNERPRRPSAGSQAEMPAGSNDGKEMSMPMGTLARMAEDMEGLPESARAWLRELKLPPEYSEPQSRYDPMAVVDGRRLRSATEVVDHYAKRLLDMPLPRDRRQVLIDTLEPDGQRFDPRDPTTPGRIRGMIHLILSTPEYQLN